MRHLIFTLILFLSAWSFSSCAEKKNSLKIGVISDPHYLSEQLMDNGSAIKNYDIMSGKAVSEVPAVLEQVLADFEQNKPEILLIPGDMTKDGEKQSHIDFVEKLRPLREKGVRIFVIPGNHDINMPNSMGYEKDKTYPVPNVNPDEFVKIYADCGYNDALKKDQASLSYVAELNETTWLLAIDVCRYKEYTDRSISGGKLSPQTEQWVIDVLQEAKEKNIQVVGMMHHGLVEHIMMQSSFFPEYLVDDWKRVATLLADSGMKAIFTGHFHSNDIAEYTSEAGNKIYDIETGSLAVYAFPYRFVELSENKMKIQTKNIISTPSSPDLAEKNKAVMQSRAKEIAISKIKSRGIQLSDNTLQVMADIISQVFVMHLKGDEKIDDNLRQSMQKLATELDSPIDVSDEMFGFDSYPTDNNVEIEF